MQNAKKRPYTCHFMQIVRLNTRGCPRIRKPLSPTVRQGIVHAFCGVSLLQAAFIVSLFVFFALFWVLFA